MGKYKLVLPSEEVAEVHYGCPRPVEIEGSTYREVEHEMWDQKRWSVVSLWVIERTDLNGNVTYWRTFLETGATECQDHDTLRSEEWIEFDQVDKIPTVTYKWEVIK